MSCRWAYWPVSSSVADLKQLEVSGPAILHGLRLQHAFEELHSSEDCRNIIESYVGGWDNGLTENTMRLSCGMKKKAVVETALPAPLAGIADGLLLSGLVWDYQYCGRAEHASDMS